MLENFLPKVTECINFQVNYSFIPSYRRLKTAPSRRARIKRSLSALEPGHKKWGSIEWYGTTATGWDAYRC